MNKFYNFCKIKNLFQLFNFISNIRNKGCSKIDIQTIPLLQNFPICINHGVWILAKDFNAVKIQNKKCNKENDCKVSWKKEFALISWNLSVICVWKVRKMDDLKVRVLKFKGYNRILYDFANFLRLIFHIVLHMWI